MGIDSMGMGGSENVKNPLLVIFSVKESSSNNEPMQVQLQDVIDYVHLIIMRTCIIVKLITFAAA